MLEERGVHQPDFIHSKIMSEEDDWKKEFNDKE